MDKKKDISTVNRPTIRKEPAQKFIDTGIVQAHMKGIMKNIFAKGSINSGISEQHLLQWNLGLSKDGHTVFFYQNIKGQYVAVRIFKYDSDLHKSACWTPKGFQRKDGYRGCLFGEHFLKGTPNDKTIVLVESEKSAIIASWFIQARLWIAGGGTQGFTDERLKVLDRFNRIIIMFDCDDSGRKAAKKLKEKLGGRAIIVDLEKERDGGYDVADHLLEKRLDV